MEKKLKFFSYLLLSIIFLCMFLLRPNLSFAALVNCGDGVCGNSCGGMPECLEENASNCPSDCQTKSYTIYCNPSTCDCFSSVGTGGYNTFALCQANCCSGGTNPPDERCISDGSLCLFDSQCCSGDCTRLKCTSVTTPTVTLTPTITLTPTNNISPSITPPISPPPGETLLSFTIGLDGIGTTGDNQTTEHSGSNKNPVHTTRNLKVLVLDNQNNELVNKSSEMTYSSSSGKFVGTANIGQITTGIYLVKVSTDAHLRRLIPGIQTLTSGQTNSMELVNLVTGDITNDNVLDILDYNILLSCVEDPAINNPDNGELCSQDPNSKIFSDLEDNGVVNQFDYNLFVREYAVQNGN